MRARIGRLELAKPVMTASGTFGFGEEYRSLVDLGALGAIVTKGISLRPRAGNPAPRIAETPCGMLNAVGLENPGLEAFLRDKLPGLREMGPAVVVNILGDTLEDYAALARALDGAGGVDALEVNISCPNVERGGLAFGTDPALAAEVAAAVRESTRLPVLVKLTPDVTDIAAVARAVAATGVDGLVCINTLRGMAIDPLSGRPRLGKVIGGLSGPAIRPVALRAVFEVAREVDTAVVGVGGIGCWQDAVEFLRAGAVAVQVGCATFRDPSAAVMVLRGLEDFLKGLGVRSCSQLVGAVEL
ncbi:MAG: dihydroorotate dehydrogenase [Deltaproteobacteria bacterium]|nr:dihydroorotate dehydrogenase [Deltaproteobacteria bacterium]